MKRVLSYLGFFLVVVASTFVVGLRSQSIQRPAYTLTLWSDSFRNNTSDAANSTAMTIVVLENGTTSMETRHAKEENRAPIQEIKDVASGQVTIIDHHAKLYFSRPLSAQTIERTAAPIASSCSAQFSLECKPGEKILGQNTYIVDIAPAGSNVLTRMWVAPGLAWAALKTENYVNGVLSSRISATNLIVGAPNPSVFQVPAAYRKAAALDTYTQESLDSRGLKASPAAMDELRRREAFKQRNMGNPQAATLKMKLLQFLGH